MSVGGDRKGAVQIDLIAVITNTEQRWALGGRGASVGNTLSTWCIIRWAVSLKKKTTYSVMSNIDRQKAKPKVNGPCYFHVWELSMALYCVAYM